LRGLLKTFNDSKCPEKFMPSVVVMLLIINSRSGARKLTREKWMKLTKASSRTALRDIDELIELGILEQEEAGVPPTG
jgi:Fic family protein